MVSSEVKAFLDSHIRSVQELEVLLFLRKNRARDWDVVEVAEQLGGDPVAISDNMMRLYLKGLLGNGGGRDRFYRYRYKAEGTDDTRLEIIARAVELARSEVVDYIFAKNRKQLEAFSDAFKVLKD
jgi:hypothetical protein